MTLELRARSRIDLPLALAATAVCAQVSYPLLHGPARDLVTIAIVVLYAATAFTHAAQTRGRNAALTLAAIGIGFGFAVEVLGVHTGFPFGRYEYGTSLGPRFLDVPVVIALAWPMLAWPAALVARRLASSPGVRILLGAWALATWDLFLDPQMVATGHWRWLDGGAHLPGVAGVPISDYLGWCCVSLVVSAVLQRALDAAPDGDDRVLYGLYLWTWASSAVALAVFLELPAAALWGALGMGTVAVPLARSLRR